MTERIHPEADIGEVNEAKLHRDESYLISDAEEDGVLYPTGPSSPVHRDLSVTPRSGTWNTMVGVRFEDIQGFNMDDHNIKYERQFCHVPQAHKGGYLPGITLSADGNLAACVNGKVAFYKRDALDAEVLTWQRTPRREQATSMRAVCFGTRGQIVCGGYDGSIIVYDPSGTEAWRKQEVCSGEVRAVAMSREGVLCAAGYDGSIALFGDNGVEIRRPMKEAHKGSPLLHAVFSYDGSKLATSAVDGSIIVRGQTGSAAHWEDVWFNADAHGRRKVLAMFFLTQDHLVSGGDDGSIAFFKSYGEEDKSKRIPDVHGGVSIRALALSPDPSLLAAGGKNGSIAIFILDKYGYAQPWKRIDGAHVGAKRLSLVFTSTSRIVSASSTGSYCVHDVNGAEIKEVIRRQVYEDGVPVNAIVSMVHNTFKGIATGGQNGCISFFHYHGAEIRPPMKGVHGGAAVTDMAWLPCVYGRECARDPISNTIKSKSSKRRSSRQCETMEEICNSYSGLRGYLVSAGDNGSVVVHFMEGMHETLIWQNAEMRIRKVNGVAIVGKEGLPRIAFCGDTGRLHVVSHIGGIPEPVFWDNGEDMLADAEVTDHDRVRVRPMRAVCFSADYCLACSCEDGYIRVYGEKLKYDDVFELLWKARVCSTGMAPWSLAFSPLNGYLAVGRYDGRILIFARHGEPIRTITGRRGKLRALRFAKDGCMAVGGNDGSIALYGASGEEIWSADNIHRGFRVYALTFIDERSGHIATCGDDGSINIFSPFRNQVGFRSNAHEHTKVFGVALSHKGTLASGGSGGDIVIENTRNQLRRQIDHPHKLSSLDTEDDVSSSSKPSHQVRALAFQRGPDDMEMLASAGEDGTIQIFEVPTTGHIRLLHRFFRDIEKEAKRHERHQKVFAAPMTSHIQLYALALAFPSRGTRINDRLASGWRDGSIEILRVNPKEDRFESLSCFPLHKCLDRQPQLFSIASGAVLRLSFSPDGEHLCASNGNGLVVVIILDENGSPKGLARCLNPPQPHGSSGLISVAFSPEDYFLATAGFDGSVAVWGPSFRDAWSPDRGGMPKQGGMGGNRIYRSSCVEGLVEIARVQGAHYEEKVRDLKFTATGLLVTAGANVVYLWKRPLERIGMFPFQEAIVAISVGLNGWRPWDVSIAVAQKGGKVKSFSPNEFPLSLCLKSVASLLADNKKTEELLRYHPRILAQPLPKERCSLIHYCMMERFRTSGNRTNFDNVQSLCALCIHHKIWGGLDSLPSCNTEESTNLLHLALRHAEDSRDTSIVELILSYACRLPEWCTDSPEWTAAVLQCMTLFPQHSLGVTDFLESRLVKPKQQIHKGCEHPEVHLSTADFHHSWGKLLVTHSTASSLSREELKKTIAPDGCDKMEMRVLMLPGIAQCIDSQQPLLNIIPVLSDALLTSQAVQALITHKWNEYGFRANCQGFVLHFLEIAAYTLLAVLTAEAAARDDKQVELTKPWDTVLRVVLAPLLALWVLSIMLWYKSLWRSPADVMANSVLMIMQVVGSICIIFKVMHSLWVVPLLGLTVARWELTTLVRAWQWDVGVPLPVKVRGDKGKYIRKHWRALHGRFRWLRQYLRSYWNWLDMTLMLLKFFVPSLVFWFALSLQVAALFYAILLCLLVWKTLYYLRALQHIGHFTSMIWEVWSSTIWFTGVMAIILVSFASAWMVLALANPDAHYLQEEDTEMCESDENGGFACGSGPQQFANVWAVFLASFFVMYRLVFVGDFSGDSFALADWSAIPGDEPTMATALPAWIVFMLGTIFFLVVMLNLLIAIINDRYRELMDQSNVRFWRERAMISIEAEMFVQDRSRSSSEKLATSINDKKWPDDPPRYLMMSFPNKNSAKKTLDDKIISKVARDVHGISIAYQNESEEDLLKRRMDTLSKNMSKMHLCMESLSQKMSDLSAVALAPQGGPLPQLHNPREDADSAALDALLATRQISFASLVASPRENNGVAEWPEIQCCPPERPETGDPSLKRTYTVCDQRPPTRHGSDLWTGQQYIYDAYREAGREGPRSRQTDFSDSFGSWAGLRISRSEEFGQTDSLGAIFAEQRHLFRTNMCIHLGVPMGPLPGLKLLQGPDISEDEFAQALELPRPDVTRMWAKLGYQPGDRISREIMWVLFGIDESPQSFTPLSSSLPRPGTGNGRPHAPQHEPAILAFEDGQPRLFGAASGTLSLASPGTSLAGASPTGMQDLGLGPTNSSHVTAPTSAPAPLAAVMPTAPQTSPPRAPPPPPPPAAAPTAGPTLSAPPRTAPSRTPPPGTPPPAPPPSAAPPAALPLAASPSTVAGIAAHQEDTAATAEASPTALESSLELSRTALDSEGAYSQPLDPSDSCLDIA